MRGWLWLLAGLWACGGEIVDVGINEVGDATPSLTDEAGESEPWVELVNTTAEPRELGGWTLSLEQEDGTLSWVLADELALGAGGFLVLWIDGETAEGARHAPWTLDQSGGVLTLAAPEGFSETVTYPALDDTVSFGRVPDGQRNWQLLDPSPGVSNE